METQPDLYGGPEVPAILTPPMREFPPEPKRERVRTPVDVLVQRASRASGVPVHEILSRQTGPRRVNRVRMAIYVVGVRDRTSPIVAKMVKREGSTVRHQAKRGRSLMLVDPAFAKLVAEIAG